MSAPYVTVAALGVAVQEGQVTISPWLLPSPSSDLVPLRFTCDSDMFPNLGLAHRCRKPPRVGMPEALVVLIQWVLSTHEVLVSDVLAVCPS